MSENGLKSAPQSLKSQRIPTLKGADRKPSANYHHREKYSVEQPRVDFAPHFKWDSRCIHLVIGKGFTQDSFMEKMRTDGLSMADIIETHFKYCVSWNNGSKEYYSFIIR
ncbi:hypothetical protein CDAR_203571 [Caerostris darwini]|uniref:Uncharacterized protein n=1 Tax=Caerostris darwini TaxID=1538125 RepID=A0AAV4TVJ2_9ARAC|nr:hypothetical protein CDAR_203571 [Caerostris darwini]